jgi:peroxiredoxin
MKPKILITLLTLFCGRLLAVDSVTVYIFLLDECPICQEATAELNALYGAKSKKIGFLGVFPNYISKPKQIAAFKEKYKVKFPTKTDYSKTLVKKFGATVMPEVVVYNERTKKVIYRGCIDDRYILPNKRKYSISYQYLRNVLAEIDARQGIKTVSTKPVGCVIEKTSVF